MKSLVMSFIRQHGERLFFIMFATVFATVMYAYIESTREQVVAVYFLLLGLIINKARSPKDEVSAQEPKEPTTTPSNIAGRVSMTFLLYLALASAGLCAILVGTYGCVTNGQAVIAAPVETKVALAKIAARHMGADMRQEFADVARQVVDAYAVIESKEGVAYQEGVFSIAKMILEREGVKDSALLVADCRDVLTIFGIQLPGTSGFDLAWLQQFDPVDIRAVCEAFLEGADSDPQASVGDMWEVNYPVGPYHGGRLVTYLPDGIEVR